MPSIATGRDVEQVCRLLDELRTASRELSQTRDFDTSATHHADRAILRSAALRILCGQYGEARRQLIQLRTALPAIRQALEQDAKEDWERRVDDFAEHARAHGMTGDADFSDRFGRVDRMIVALCDALPAADAPEADAVAAALTSALATNDSATSRERFAALVALIKGFPLSHVPVEVSEGLARLRPKRGQGTEGLTTTP
jgi:hypothetical protein